MSEISLKRFFSNGKEKVFSFLIPPVGRKAARGISVAIGLASLCLMQACISSDIDSPLSESESPAVVCERTKDMPPGLKMKQYRGITPECVPNGQTLDIPGLQLLIEKEEPILIDVWAIVRSVDDGFGSMWLPNEEHYSLPGAVWLPNVGYGKIKPDIEKYLKDNLQRLTEGDKDKPLVFFCVMDCWMSWNTVQRVTDYGYTKVYWYRNGTDSWEEAGFPLIEIQPVELE